MMLSANRRTIIVSVFLVTLIVAAAILYSFRLGRGIADRYIPLTEAAVDVRVEVTTARLWFDEITVGVRPSDIETAWKHLDAAEWYANAMLSGGENYHGKIIPVEDKELEARIGNSLDLIDEFRGITEVLWFQGVDAEFPLSAHNRLNVVFNELIESTKQLETYLRASIKQHLLRLDLIQAILIGIIVLSGAAVVLVFLVYDRARTESLSTLRDRDEKLRESRKRYRALFEKSNDAIFIVSKNTGQIQDANMPAEKLSGYSHSELIQLNTKYLAPEGADLRQSRIAKTYGTVELGEVTFVRPNYSERITRLMAIPLDSMNIIYIAHDITAERLAERQLRRAQKMDAVGQLTGGIAHDFNNILGVILGNMELLELELDNCQKALRRIADTRESTRRATRLIKQLLGFSRDQAEQQSLTDINALMIGMNDLIARSVTPEVEIVQNLASDLWLTEIDTDDFKDALLNLVLNARDAMPGGGKLTLESRNSVYRREDCSIDPECIPGEFVEMIISDDGTGIPPYQRDRIFEPFFSSKKEGKGTGLGLAMVFGFVKRSKGFIKVYSEPGVGTVVQISLPRADKRLDLPIKSTPALPHTLPKGGHERLLLVDDEEPLLRITTESLLLLGYDVLTATNAQDALQLLQTDSQIQLLITDVVMPGGMDGFELLQTAKFLRPGLKVILISGFAGYAQNDSKKHYPEVKILLKPFTQDELARHIRQGFDEVSKRSLAEPVI